jgi:hypothetical protein
MPESTRAPIIPKDELRWFARFGLGLLGTLFFWLMGLVSFSHKCAEGNKTFESIAPWIVAAFALSCVVFIRRIWLSVLALVLLSILLHFSSVFYHGTIHHDHTANQ